MSANIEPSEVESLDGEEVRRYDLPHSYRDPLLSVDTTGSGYSAEWLVNLEVEEFEELVYSHVMHRDTDAKASFESKLSGNESVQGTATDILEHERYPRDCTYLLFQTPIYDIGWEKWESNNSLILNVPDHNARPLEEYFEDTMEREGVSQNSLEKALEEATAVISERK
jgi:hypothetical protein